MEDQPVLNISGNCAEEKLTRKLRRQRKERSFNAVPEPPAPKVNVNTFPLILSKMLLKSSTPPTVPKIPSEIPYYSARYGQYLGLVWLQHRLENVSLFHMFCSSEGELHRDYERIRENYENYTNFTVNYTDIHIETFCARSLMQSMQRNFKSLKFKTGNVFEMTGVPQANHLEITNALKKLHSQELDKMYNYLKYVNVNSV